MWKFWIIKKKTSGTCRYVPEIKTGFNTTGELNSIITTIKTQRKNIDANELLDINTKILELKKLVKDSVAENTASQSVEISVDELTDFEKEITNRKNKIK